MPRPGLARLRGPQGRCLRRFELGIPDEVLRSTERAWTVAPTSKRIVEDILALPRVLSKIIE